MEKHPLHLFLNSCNSRIWYKNQKILEQFHVDYSIALLVAQEVIFAILFMNLLFKELIFLEISCSVSAKKILLSTPRDVLNK